MRSLKRIGIIAVFLAVALLKGVFASDTILNATNPGLTLLFSDWTYNGESVDAGGLIFEVSAGSGGEVAYFQSDAVSEFVREDDCKIEGTYGLCVDVIDTDDDRRRSSVRIYWVRAHIDIEGSVSDSSPFVGETIEITKMITNDGILLAEDILMEDSFPRGFELIAVRSPCSKSGNNAFYSGSLSPGDYVECTYEVRPEKILSLTQNTRIKYFNGVEEVDEFGGDITIDVDDYLTSKGVFNATSAKLKEIVQFNMTLQNHHGEDTMKLTDFSIVFPPELEVVRYDSKVAAMDKGRYGRTAALTITNSTSFVFHLYPTSVGSYFITAAGTYSVEQADKDFRIESDRLSATITELELHSDTDTSTKESYEEEKVVVWAENKNSFVEFRNLVARFNNPELLYISDIVMSELLPGKSRKLVDISFRVPYVNTTMTYDLGLNVSYETEFGRERSKSFSRTITVSPVPDLSITQTISKSEIYAGNVTGVKVSVKNNRDVDLEDIEIWDDIGPLMRRGRNRIAELDLDSDESADAYSYHIYGPDVGGNTGFNITTYARYEREGINFTYDKTGSFTVKPLPNATHVPPNASVKLTRALVDSSVALRDTIEAGYTLTNDGSLKVMHISVGFPVQYGFDLVGEKNYFVPALNPEEEIELPGYVSFRPKLNGTLYLRGESISYLDESGNEYHEQNANTTITVTQALNFSRPALLIEKGLPLRAREWKSTLINITLENLGTEKVEAVVYDHDKRWEVSVRGNAKKLIQHHHRFSALGFNSVGAAVVVYVIDGQKYMTSSRVPVIEVVEAVDKEPAADSRTAEVSGGQAAGEEVPEEIQETLPGIDLVDESPKEEATKNILLRIIDYIIAFFR